MTQTPSSISTRSRCGARLFSATVHSLDSHRCSSTLQLRQLDMRRTLLVAHLMIGVAACRSESVRPISTSTTEVPNFIVKGQPQNARQLSPDEQRIVDELVAMYPESEALFRAVLADRRVVVAESKDPKVQALLTRLDSVRSAHNRAAQESRASKASITNVTVAMVDSLGDGAANAVVIRRLKPSEDVILLRTSDATGAALGGAIATLYKLRKQYGDAPHDDVRVMVYNGQMPRGWPDLMKAQAEQTVQQLRESKTKNVKSIGQARVATIPLLSVNTIATSP